MTARIDHIARIVRFPGSFGSRARPSRGEKRKRVLEQLAFRLLVGGTVVCAFSVLADALKPKSFAGLLGAAPSVALATLALTIRSDGSHYAQIEARSMVGGAAAFLVYAWAVCHILSCWKFPVWAATSGLLVVWLVVAFAIWGVALR